MVKRILFVCTGNTCRSPLAEGLLKQKAKEAGIRLEVRSAGVAAVDGMPISEHSRTILKEKGVDEPISSRALSQESVQWADLILTMTMSHKQSVLRRFPEAAEKTFALKEYVEDDAETKRKLEEFLSLRAELELKRAAKEEIPGEQWEKLKQLEQNLPHFDIADPFGGSLEIYRLCSEEIEGCLDKLLSKLNPH